jgi:hypothetical protein
VLRLLTERELTFLTFVCPQEIKPRAFPQRRVHFDLQPWCRSSEDVSRSESDPNSYLSPGSLNNVIISRWKIARSLAGGSKATYRAPVLESLSSSFLVKPHAVLKVPMLVTAGRKGSKGMHFTTPRASSSRLANY